MSGKIDNKERKALRRTSHGRKKFAPTSPAFEARTPLTKFSFLPSFLFPRCSKSTKTNAKAGSPLSRRRSSQQQPLFESIHHVGLLVSDLEKSLQFYQGTLGLSTNPDRPDARLPYRGAWLWVGRPEDGQMVHLMELPSPDPTEGRPAHGGRDRHFCVSVRSVDKVVERLKGAEVAFTVSASGRKAVFFRDPDSNVIECSEMGK